MKIIFPVFYLFCFCFALFCFSKYVEIHEYVYAVFGRLLFLRLLRLRSSAGCWSGSPFSSVLHSITFPMRSPVYESTKAALSSCWLFVHTRYLKTDGARQTAERQDFIWKSCRLCKQAVCRWQRTALHDHVLRGCRDRGNLVSAAAAAVAFLSR